MFSGLLLSIGCNSSNVHNSSINEISFSKSSAISTKPNSTLISMPNSSQISTNTTKGPEASESVQSNIMEKVSVTVNKKLLPMTSENTELLNSNPDRGLRLEIFVELDQVASNKDYTQMKVAANKIIDETFEYAHKPLYFPVTIARSYIFLSAYNTRDLSPKALMAIDAYFEVLSERKLKALVTFVYERVQQDKINYVEQGQLLRHIEQVAPVIKKHKGDIHVLHAGFIGLWGEFHSEYVPLDRTVILRKICETLLPDGIYLQVRMPYYKNLLPTDYHFYRRIGFHNDGYFGKDPTIHFTGTDPDFKFDVGSLSWNQVVKQSPYTPQDGELYFSVNDPMASYSHQYADGYESILMFSEHRYTTFNGQHGNTDYYGISADHEPFAMDNWRNQKITIEWLKENNIIGSPSWFKDKNGKIVKRNVYDFIRSNLGYYLEMQSVKVTGESKTGKIVSVTVPVINYGFSAAFNMHSGFAILDSKNKLMTSVSAGNPETWYNRSPIEYNDGKLLTHIVSAKLKLPEQSGEYRLAFYIKNERGDFAQMANNMEFTNGYHILQSFTI